jgi:hypothetical protein
LFDIDYYREPDMKHYTRRDIYFVENGKVYNHKEFMNNSYYEPIMKGIASFKFPDNQNFPSTSLLMAEKNKTKMAQG